VVKQEFVPDAIQFIRCYSGRNVLANFSQGLRCNSTSDSHLLDCLGCLNI
jgi:hypothetical protein